MAVQWNNGIPYLSNDSLIGDVPEYTQLLARGAMPVASIIAFAGVSGSKPEGWFFCNGASYSREDYPILAGILGSRYGGDATNFNVPNLTGRVLVASGHDGAAVHAKTWTVGERPGSHLHTLSLNEMPSHNHRLGANYMFQGVGADSFALGDASPHLKQGVETSTDAKGSGLAHNNTQPSTVVDYYVIKHDYPLHG